MSFLGTKTPSLLQRQHSQQTITTMTMPIQQSRSSGDLSNSVAGSLDSWVDNFNSDDMSTTMRIRITNQTSKRFKDLVVTMSDDVFVFDSVYNHDEVKKANVRKWSSDVVKKVKEKTSEIMCFVMDDSTGNPFYTLSVSDMKTTSTKKLNEMAKGCNGNLIKLVLSCQEKKTYNNHHQNDKESSISESQPSVPVSVVHTVGGDSSSSSPYHEKSITDLSTTTPNSKSKKIIKLPTNNDKAAMRVRVLNDTSGRSKDLLVTIDEKTNLFDEIYNNQAIKDAHVRKWGSEIVKNVKNKVAEIKFHVWDEEINKPFHTLSVEELKTTTTKQLYEIAAEPNGIIQLVLRCETIKPTTTTTTTAPPPNAPPVVPQKPKYHRANSADSLMAEYIDELVSVKTSSTKNYLRDDIASIKSRSFAELESIYPDSHHEHNSGIAESLDSTNTKKTVRVRIQNQKTKRFKDLVIDIRRDLTVYDAIYDNQAVKDANIRKWGSEIAKQVKSGTAEIQLEIWDDIHPIPFHICSIPQLHIMSTKALVEMSPASMDPIQLRLQCVTKAANEKTSLPDDSKSGGLSLSSNEVTVSSDSKKKQSFGAILPKRHMSFAGDMKRESISSLNDQVNMRANYQFGMSGLRNESWSLSSKSPKKMKEQLFSKQIDPIPMAQVEGTSASGSSTNLNEKETSKGDLTNASSLAASGTMSGKDQSSSSDLDGKVKRFLRLSSTEKEAEAQKLKNRLNATPKGRSIHVRDTTMKSNVSDLSITSHKDVTATGDKVQRFLALSKGEQESLKALFEEGTLGNGDNRPEAKKLTTPISGRRKSASDALWASPDGGAAVKEFLRLCRAKKSKELEQESGNGTGTERVSPIIDKDDAKINRFLQLSKASAVNRDSLSSVGSITLKVEGTDSESKESPISKEKYQSESSLSHYGKHSSRSSTSTKPSEKDKLKRFLSLSSNDFVPPLSKDSRKNEAPPIAEISVITHGPIEGKTSSTNQGVSFSGDLLKEVFPYHVALDADFRILQVGNSLPMLFDDIDSSVRNETNFVGRIVSDILMVTGPIPMFGQWDWSVLDRMKEKTIFFESVLTESTTKKARLKGTLIEISRHPRKILLNLLPNVKNLTELSNMDLSMGDLPLHSCQREAVLLGEHSASEVKLTNHLDMLHRDLINSMEQQINDRTNELATANEDLEKANTQIQEQAARQLEHFACMSHEIRTPLNCIVGMSSILLEETNAQIDPTLSESIQMIFTSGELLRAVVDDVLDYAKLESGSFEVDICKINLQDSLAGVIHSISQKIQDKNIRLRTHFSADLPKFTETDSRRLQQVLFNLLGNSGKFSKTNSVIDLSVSLVPKSAKSREDRFICDPSNSNELENHDVVRFVVKDYGKGIDEKDFATIFQPFSQASKQTATVYGGTGLGLSITSKLVHRLGGEISLNSELGKFAQFTVDLPFKGEVVNTELLRKQLDGTVIMIVDSKETFDYSFTPHQIDDEPEAFSQEVVDRYNLDIDRFETIQNLSETIAAKDSKTKEKHIAILLKESLYDEKELAKIMEVVGSQSCTVMTFGPNYEVEATKQRHFRSLLGSFPSILLESIASHVAMTKQGMLSSAVKLTSPPQGKSIVELSSESPGSIEEDVKTNKYPVQTNQEPATSEKDLTIESRAPSTSTKARQPKKKDTEPPPCRRNLKVLYAEDNKINQKVLSRVLNRVGITDITIVDDGLKAVNISEKEKYDIIFMDMQMPVMDGMEACSLIVERDKDAKVVFVTAHALDEFKAKAEAAGGISFISKPFRVQDIDKILAELDFT